MNLQELKEKARRVRIDVIKMLTRAGSGHPGGSLSSADILVALFFYKMRHDPENPEWPERDRFILSKGHCCPALYAVLSMAGYFERKHLWTLRKLGSILQGHPSSTMTPGVTISSGSLGQGLSVSNGIALAGKLDKKDYRVYCMLGDGESQEGQVWEASMTSFHRRLDNLCAIIDHNDLQIDDRVSRIKDPISYAEKWSSFGWNTIEIDGHDMGQIVRALDEAEKVKRVPTMIVANTIKGKGVSFMEDDVTWHGRAPNELEAKKALEELGGDLDVQ
ncbi:transketolase [candidate division TA06 bacterium]|uniref:Transketolase n=1 Tax=candidate division TA06 bacterium TaxID=2250710 RepID=A0A523XIT5_UNCT6|nr:MAG: transketolase [candidate division TA06 bacterium]